MSLFRNFILARVLSELSEARKTKYITKLSSGKKVRKK